MSEIQDASVAKIVQDVRETYVEPATRRITYCGKRTRCVARQGCEREIEQRLRECACVEIDREASGTPFERPMNLSCRLMEWFTDGTELSPDFAPLSFLFHDHGIFGGIIFHGAHDRGGDGGAPTFSVNLAPCNGWSIHT